MADQKLGNKTSASQEPEEEKPKEEDLQHFTHWDETPVTDDTTTVNRGSWSVEEMFRKNQSMGVQSTFKDDLTQYTTVPAEGSKEDRARAAKIAKEIETCEKSKRMAYLENDDEERDLDKETVIPDEAVKDEGNNQAAAGYHQQKRNSRGSKGGNNKSFPRKEMVVPENHRANALRDPPKPTRNPQPAPPLKEVPAPKEVAAPSVSDTAQSETTSEQTNHSEAETLKFQFNPEAPTFVPRPLPPLIAPIVTMAQPHFIAQPYSQGYATTGHIPQSLTNSLPPGYILTQAVGMQQNPNMIQPTFIPQQLQYVPAGVPIYNPQIVTSSQGGGGAGGYYAATAQPQTFVVRSNYDLTNAGGTGYVQGNQQHPRPQHHHQIQYATMPLQFQVQPQQQHHYQQQPQQHFQAQLPYTQQPPRRYGHH